MAKISGMVFSKPPKYMLRDNPFDFMTEFDQWFWYMKEIHYNKRYWFEQHEIPVERCNWRE